MNFDEFLLGVRQHGPGLSDDGQGPFVCFCEEVCHHVAVEDGHWEGHDEQPMVDQAGRLASSKHIRFDTQD